MIDVHRRLVQAIADPGHWTPRGDNYEESIPSWSARAVAKILGLETDEIPTVPLGGAVSWVRSQGIVLNAEQARCVHVLCSIGQPYNLQLIGDGWQTADVEDWDEQEDDFDSPPLLQPVRFGAHWLIVHLRGSYSTFDMPELTRLVLAGHRHAVRVEFSPQVYRWVQTDDIHEGEEPATGAGACLRIALHARKRDPDTHVWEWHPSIGQALIQHGGAPA